MKAFKEAKFGGPYLAVFKSNSWALNLEITPVFGGQLGARDLIQVNHMQVRHSITL